MFVTTFREKHFRYRPLLQTSADRRYWDTGCDRPMPLSRGLRSDTRPFVATVRRTPLAKSLSASLSASFSAGGGDRVAGVMRPTKGNQNRDRDQPPTIRQRVSPKRQQRESKIKLTMTTIPTIRPVIRFLSALSLLLLAMPATAAPLVRLARAGQPLLPVVTAESATEDTQLAANELADYLGRMAGTKFKVTTGEPAGIVVGKLADFDKLPLKIQFGDGPFAREEYVLRSHADGLFLIGATDLAVSHAVWDLLYRLGYRQYFPGETWEIVPQTTNLQIAVDAVETPSFHARRIWYNWGLWDYNRKPYQDWCRRNRAVKGFDLNSGHAYGQIIASNRQAFDTHPEYFAEVDGQRKFLGSDTKFCIANPGLRKLVAEHAVRTVQQRPQLDSLSMDPSDGGNWCQCEACTKLGTPSTRVVTLANEVAAAINKLGLGDKYVGMYAYNKHSTPPAIKVHPKVIPSATTAFIGGGLSFDQVVRGWQSQGATMGCYDYLSVIAWDWNLPRQAKGSRPHAIAEFLPKIHGMGVRFYDAESGDCWGPCGLGYFVAARLLWDIEEAAHVDALIDEFLTTSFGPAEPPMRKFYTLINNDTQRRAPSDVLGRMYRHLHEAREATNNPDIRRRIDDLVLYTRYAELYFAKLDGKAATEDVVRHAYRMRKTMLVHSYGVWARLVGQKAAHTAGHPLKDETPFTAADIARFIADGITNHTPVDPGFESVTFSRELVPAAPLNLPQVSPGTFPPVPQDRQQYYIWVPQGMNSVDLSVTVQKVWANRMPQASLFSQDEVTGDAVSVFTDYRPDNKPYKIQLPTTHSGLHRVEFLDGGDYTRIVWPDGMPVTIESGVDTPRVKSHFRGSWTLYFYVPKGTKTVGGWASRIANWAPKVSGVLENADGKIVWDFGEKGAGWFRVPVAAGQDGRLWKFVNSQGERLLMTVPPYLARSERELLLPKETVEADRRE